MKQKGKRTLTPKLRFPEFRRGSGWESRTLRDLAEIVTGKTPSTKEADLWCGEVLFITPTDISEDGKYQHDTQRKVAQIKSIRILPAGSIVYTCIASIGKMAITVRESTTNQQINSVIPKPSVNKDFIYYALASLTPWIKSIPSSSTLPIINKSEFSKICISIPKDPAEQQKIAECLSSLDGLIAAEGRKLAALRDHKRGLMQQLFPQPGQTQPRLRFAEFQNAGEWKNKTLGEVADYENGKAHEQDIDENGKYIVVNSKFISTEGEVKKHSNTINLAAKKDDILMVLSDVPNGRAIAKCFLVDKDKTYTVNQRICKLTARSTVSLLLFYILDRNTYFLAFDDGVKQTNLKKDDVLQCPIMLPEDEKEQKMIADCLAALDTQITAQAAKIETLKTHKRGLMQQLFPAPEDNVS